MSLWRGVVGGVGDASGMVRKPIRRYGSLTAALEDKASPLRRHLDERYPNKATLQAEYRDAAGPLLVPSGEANPGTLGTAFDYVIRFLLDPADVPELAFTGFGKISPEVPVIIDIVRTAQTAAGSDRSRVDEDLYRACWVLALCTEVYRAGALMPGSPLVTAIQTDRVTREGLMALASADAIRQLQAMQTVAVENLLPHLPSKSSRLALGPTFDGSALCPADADLVTDGLLLEIKTRLGALNKNTGLRSDTLPLGDLYQLLGYVLFDHSDSFAIRELGFYSGRYGNLTKWEVAVFLNTFAGKEVRLDVERDLVWKILGGS
jgi:hypothetical protein